jgi:hypothetical protein
MLLKESILGIIVVLINLFFILAIYLIQIFESKRKLIPKRKKNFLYLWDFNTGLWGDLIGLSLIDLSLISMGFNLGIITISLLISLAATTIFHLRCIGEKHKPDAGYPSKGKTSLSGRLHLVYFFVQFEIFVYTLINFISPRSTNLKLTWILGLSIYATSFFIDIFQGKFDNLK